VDLCRGGAGGNADRIWNDQLSGNKSRDG